MLFCSLCSFCSVDSERISDDAWSYCASGGSGIASDRTRCGDQLRTRTSPPRRRPPWGLGFRKSSRFSKRWPLVSLAFSASGLSAFPLRSASQSEAGHLFKKLGFCKKICPASISRLRGASGRSIQLPPLSGAGRRGKSQAAAAPGRPAPGLLKQPPLLLPLRLGWPRCGAASYWPALRLQVGEGARQAQEGHGAGRAARVALRGRRRTKGPPRTRPPTGANTPRQLSGPQVPSAAAPLVADGRPARVGPAPPSPASPALGSHARATPPRACRPPSPPSWVGPTPARPRLLLCRCPGCRICVARVPAPDARVLPPGQARCGARTASG